MSDSPASLLALGYLAGGSPLAMEGALTLTRALRNRNHPSIDVNSLISVIQQMEAHIAQQDDHIADLAQRLRSTAEERDKLREWTRWADVELRKRWNKP